jgi:hypothetical protein
MLKSVIVLLSGMMLALPLAAAEPAAAPVTEGETVEQALVKFRDDLQAAETEVVSKAISLTSDEATAFWPVFKEFQGEQRSVIDDQIAAVRKYAENFATLSEEDSQAYVNALLERDQKIHDLRVEYLAKYSKVIGKNKAARVIHLSRRLGLAAQAKLAAGIPLVR